METTVKDTMKNQEHLMTTEQTYDLSMRGETADAAAPPLSVDSMYLYAA